MTARYLLCPGPVLSRHDRQVHHITAPDLAALYGVRFGDCLVLPALGRELYPCERLRLLERSEPGGDLIALYPRDDGDYRLPQPTPSKP